MEIKATMKFDDKTVTIDTRTRYRLKFSKYLEFKKGVWEQEVIVDYYSTTSNPGFIRFHYDNVEYHVTMRNLDMIAKVKPT